MVSPDPKRHPKSRAQGGSRVGKRRLRSGGNGNPSIGWDDRVGAPYLFFKGALLLRLGDERLSRGQSFAAITGFFQQGEG